MLARLICALVILCAACAGAEAQPSSVLYCLTSASGVSPPVYGPCGTSATPLYVTATGSGEAVTVADGADVAQGTTTDAACATDNGTCTVVALLKRVAQRVTTLIANIANTIVMQAGENHIGEVGGNIFPITSALVTSNATVTTGQAIGPLQTLANAARVSGSLGASGTGGYIQSSVVTFSDAVAGTQADIFYFDANPSGSTCTNASAFVLADADRGKVIGVMQAVTLIAGNTRNTLQVIGPALPFGLSSATSIFACVVARASFVITSTANATLKTTVLRN